MSIFAGMDIASTFTTASGASTASSPSLEGMLESMRKFEEALPPKNRVVRRDGKVEFVAQGDRLYATPDFCREIRKRFSGEFHSPAVVASIPSLSGFQLIPTHQPELERIAERVGGSPLPDWEFRWLGLTR